MIILLKILYLILDIFTYLLAPFAWLVVEFDDIRSETENKIIYYVMSIPYWLVFPFSYLWVIIQDCKIDVLFEKVKYKK